MRRVGKGGGERPGRGGRYSAPLALCAAVAFLLPTAAVAAPESVIPIEAPDQGVLYVRYGRPGAVLLPRGNLSIWRARIRAVLDSVSAGRNDEVADGLIDVLNEFASSGDDIPGGLDVRTDTSLGSAIVAGRGPESGIGAGGGRFAAPRPRTKPARADVPILVDPQPAPNNSVAGIAAPLVAATELGGRSDSRSDGAGAVPSSSVAGGTGGASDLMDATGRVRTERQRPLDAVVPLTVATPETLRVALKERRVVQTQAILFETARAEILPGAEPMMEELAEVLRDEPGIRLRVEGHTDVRGSAIYNLRLSERRAASIRDWLVQNGIGPDRITAIGLGESEPFDNRTTLEAHAFNRRVVFRVLADDTN